MPILPLNDDNIQSLKVVTGASPPSPDHRHRPPYTVAGKLILVGFEKRLQLLTRIFTETEKSLGSRYYLHHSWLLPKTPVKSRISGGEMFAWRRGFDQDSLRSLKSSESSGLTENHNCIAKGRRRCHLHRWRSDRGRERLRTTSAATGESAATRIALSGGRK
ncbi:hypothetical protein JCGZ_05209 [Jatropha curcas]|uniref:Uncharacterized protein n=1 Tax=Jatropha curcas TaxID=180498 RepID=A0A067L0X9_JATCU|nr:hypothetical protein JCGZ_05209 [Jatropha curcas]